MSMTWDEARAEEYYDELRAEFTKEAVENFTAERLRSYYEKEPAIAEKPFNALAEARQLLQTPHHTAAFIHAVIAVEVMLKGVMLKPILYGFIHSDSMAPLIVEMAFPSTATGFERIKDLLARIFKDVSNLDLLNFRRNGSSKPLWEEVQDVQKRRNKLVHRAETATKAESELAVAVAAAVVEDVFPALAKSLGYHLHDGFRLCSDRVCLMRPEARRILEESGWKNPGRTS